MFWRLSSVEVWLGTSGGKNRDWSSGGDKLEHLIFRGILSSKVPKGIAFAKRYFFQWKNAFWQKSRHEIKINYKVKKVASFYIIIIRQEKGDSLVTWGRTKDGKNRRKSFSYKNKLQPTFIATLSRGFFIVGGTAFQFVLPTPPSFNSTTKTFKNIKSKFSHLRNVEIGILAKKPFSQDFRKYFVLLCFRLIKSDKSNSTEKQSSRQNEGGHRHYHLIALQLFKK